MSDKLKLVSVIMPVYKVEKYIKYALNSVLDQTYKKLEIIIVNDGSPDKSVSICEEIRDVRSDTRVQIISQENKGLAEARNTGIRNASGAYIAFLDGDDVWLPEMIQKHVDHLDRCPEVGVSFSPSSFIDEESQSLNFYQKPRLKEITPAYLLRCNPVGNGSAGVFRREAFDDVGFDDASGDIAYYDKEFLMSQDTECLLRILIQTNWKLEGIPDILTLYRVSSSAISANPEKRIYFWEKMFDKVSQYAPELIEQSGATAMAYRRRDLARESVRRQNSVLAISVLHKALSAYPRMLLEEPVSTLKIAAATYSLAFMPSIFYSLLLKATELNNRRAYKKW